MKSMAKDWIRFFQLTGDPFNTIPLQSESDFKLLFIKPYDIDKYIDPLLDHFEESRPFLRMVVGPRGSGKSTILHYAISVVRKKKNVVACYVSHQPSVIEGLSDPVHGIGNDTISKLLMELTRATLLYEDQENNSELLEIAKEIGITKEGRLVAESHPLWSYSAIEKKLQRLLEYLKLKNIKTLVSIDNYDKHNEDIALRFLCSHHAQALFEQLELANVSIFLTADVEWSEKVAKNSDLNYLGEPISLSPINPIEASLLIQKRIADKQSSGESTNIFDDDAIALITVKEDGIVRTIMETCRICLIEAANKDQKKITKNLTDEIIRTRESRGQKYYECIKNSPKAIDALTQIVNLSKDLDPDTFRKSVQGLVNFWQGEKIDGKTLELLREKRLLYLVIPVKSVKSEVDDSTRVGEVQVPSDVKLLLENVGKRYSLNAFADWLAKGEPSIFFVPTTKEQDSFNQMKSQLQELLPLFNGGDTRQFLRNAQMAYNSWCSQIESGDYDVAQVLSDMWSCLWNLSLCDFYAVKIIIEEKVIENVPTREAIEAFLIEQEGMRSFLPNYTNVENYYRYSEKDIPIEPATVERLHLDAQQVANALIDCCKTVFPYLRSCDGVPAFRVKNAEELQQHLSPFLKKEEQYSFILLTNTLPRDFTIIFWPWRNYLYGFYLGDEELKKYYSVDTYEFKVFEGNLLSPNFIVNYMSKSKMPMDFPLRFLNLIEFSSYLIQLSRKERVQLRLNSKSQAVYMTLFSEGNEIIASVNYLKPNYGVPLDLNSSVINRIDEQFNQQIICQQFVEMGQHNTAKSIIEETMKSFRGNVFGILDYIDGSTFDFLDLIPKSCNLKFIASVINPPQTLIQRKAAELGKSIRSLEIKEVDVMAAFQSSGGKMHQRWLACDGSTAFRKNVCQGLAIDFGTDLKSGSIANTQHKIQVYTNPIEEKKRFEEYWYRTEEEWDAITGKKIASRVIYSRK